MRTRCNTLLQVCRAPKRPLFIYWYLDTPALRGWSRPEDDVLIDSASVEDNRNFFAAYDGEY